MLGQRFFSKGNKPLQPRVMPMTVAQPVAPIQPVMAVAPQQMPMQPVQMVEMPLEPVQAYEPEMAMSPQPIGTPVAYQPQPVVPQMPAPAMAQGNVFDTDLDATKRSGLDILTHLSQRSSQVMFKAAGKASQLHVPYIDTEHLLYGLLFDGQLFNFLKSANVQPVAIQKAVEGQFERGNFDGQPQFSPRVKKVLELAQTVNQQVGSAFIAPEHLLIALIEERDGVAAQILAQQNVSAEALTQLLGQNQQAQHEAAAEGEKRTTLEDFAVDLTAKAKAGKLDPVIGRANEIERTIHILSRRTKNNPALIGEAGTGKTAIVEGLAQRIAQGSVPDDLARKRILSLDLTSLVAGASKRGEFEDRLKHIIKEVQQAAGEIILFIDEMHNIIGTGGGDGTMDTGNILKPYLARGEIQVIGTDTLAEYHRYIEKDPALERRFQPVIVPEPTIEEAIEMIKGLRNKYETFHKVTISDEAVEAAVKLSSRYIGDRFLPDKAVDLIDEASSLKRLPAISLPEEMKSLQTQLAKVQEERLNAEKTNNKAKIMQAQKDLADVKQKLDDLVARWNKQKGSQTNVVEPSDIEDIVSRWTGIPITRLTESESEKLLHLEDRIHKRLIDQQGAVAAVAEAVRRGRVGLKAAKRPIGSFLFLGPTGTGKTEMAKTLAEVLFGSEDLMIRLDMTEYMEKHEVAKLIGAPPGYVGYEEGGQLTEAVRRKPYSVVLLDEVEKAHPDVFNILIQILEDGRLTDNKGRTISFKNTILICTSNLGSTIIQGEDLSSVNVQNIQSTGDMKTSATGKLTAKDQAAAQANAKFAELSKKLMEELKKFFRPELLNRFDEIIVFKPISRDDMVKITDIQLAGTAKLLQEQNISIDIAEAAKKHLAEIGYDPMYGARPLRRLIQQQIENPISLLMIKHEINEGDTVLVNFQNGELIFSKKAEPAPTGQPGQATPTQPQILSTEQTQPDANVSPENATAQSTEPTANAATDLITATENLGVVQPPQQPSPDVPAAASPVNMTPIQAEVASQVSGAQTISMDQAPADATQSPAAATPAPQEPTPEQPAASTDPSAFFENQKTLMDQMTGAEPESAA